MKVFLAILIIIALFVMFSPLRSGPDAHADGSLFNEISPLGSPGELDRDKPGGLLSPLELQRQINTVLVRYRMDPITEDGNVGPRTAHAYMEAYSLQEAEQSQRGCYE